MTAAFALTSSGPPAPCGFPHCVLESFHEGEHEFKRDKRIEFPGPHYGQCIICGVKFVEYGDPAHPPSRICDSQACLLAMTIREVVPQPPMCACPQRPYAHELAIHTTLRREAYDRTRRYLWPWALVLAERLEPSTEKENTNG